MSYLISNEHIYAKDKEKIIIANNIITRLETSNTSIYKGALIKILEDINLHYSVYPSIKTTLSQDLERLRVFRYQVISLHAQYSKTKELRLSLLDLIEMAIRDLYTALEELINEEE